MHLHAFKNETPFHLEQQFAYKLKLTSVFMILIAWGMKLFRKFSCHSMDPYVLLPRWREGKLAVEGVHDGTGGSAEAAPVEHLQQGWDSGTNDLPHCSLSCFLFGGCTGFKSGSDKVNQMNFIGDLLRS